ncbi:MAG TPA: sigma factor-like helix-turn-helix DNA-binding protein [Candidatus Saccharimonadales bacterium]|nr:sigma factor-like helix-turn-helix DNA-binding protein [Candidatus Saccharimonadales bacterium]
MTQKDIEKKVNNILSTIEREREREIISRRFGLFDRRETLEQIGELLGITRERVRQLEKTVLLRLQADAEKGDIPGLKQIETELKDQIHELGKVAKIDVLTDALVGKESTKIDQSRVAFFAELAPALSVIPDNDHFHQAVTINEVHDSKTVQAHVGKIVQAIKDLGKPHPIDKITEQVEQTDPKHVEALASTSKHLATLNGVWGLMKWPTVNPKNIRDKIYVILKEYGKHMHFNEIADAIKESEFKRKDVTTQAIHNELIKDKRFVLIGRGIYALKEWGYKQGTVADIIAEVLKEANEPLHRDEIVKRVLKSRYVKETTILLNLQGKPQFKRTAKATYALAE